MVNHMSTEKKKQNITKTHIKQGIVNSPLVLHYFVTLLSQNIVMQIARVHNLFPGHTRDSDYTH